MADSDDEWLFSSISTFDKLHMFELEQPCTAMDWISDSQNLVIGCSSSDESRHQILELSLPPSLKATEQTGLSRERDFRTLSGGFADRAFVQVASVPESRRVLSTNLDSGDVTIWQLGTSAIDVDEICALRHFRCTPHDAADVTCSARLTLLSASKVLVSDERWAQLTELELETGAVSSSLIDDAHISNLERVSEAMCVGCSVSGALLVYDTRDRKLAMHSADGASGDAHWSSGARDTRCVCVSTSGELRVYDVRMASHVTRRATLTRGLTSASRLDVQISPDDQNIISVAGLGPKVDVFDLSISSDVTLDSCFRYDGHTRAASGPLCVTSQRWSCGVPRLLFSSATDASLHAWTLPETS